MSKVKIEEIARVIVHWSESELINDRLGCDEFSDIEKEVSVVDLEILISEASKLICCGYDKASLTVVLKSGLVWAKESKFYITKGDTLESLLNKGQ